MKGLGDFTDLLQAELALEVPGVSVLFGAEYLGRRDGQGSPIANRVVVAEHDGNGRRGQTMAVRHAHRVPADLGVHRRWVLIECWAYDGTDPKNRRRQDDALEVLFQAAWRCTQRIIRAQGHSGYPGDVPGYLQAEETTPPAPTERVLGAKSLMVFHIDFAIRELVPTTVEEPEVAVTVQLENT